MAGYFEVVGTEGASVFEADNVEDAQEQFAQFYPDVPIIETLDITQEMTNLSTISLDEMIERFVNGEGEPA